jgi:hypothetical protein
MTSESQLVYSSEELLDWNLQQLVGLSRARMLPAYGTKAKLISRIVKDQVMTAKNAAQADSSSVRSHGPLSHSSVSTVSTPTKKRKITDFDSASETPQSSLCSLCSTDLSDRGEACYNCRLKCISQADAVHSTLLPGTELSQLRSKTEFVISPELTSEISNSEGALQIQIRCTKHGASLHSWPRDCLILVDDFVVFAKEDFEDQDLPLNVTRLLTTGPHSLQVLCNDSAYSLGLYTVTRLAFN